MKVNGVLLAGFAASVMVNVFLASALFANRLRETAARPEPELVVERVAGQLPPADATLLRTAWGRHRGEVEQGLAAIHAFPERVRAALAAEPFEAAALAAAFDANAQGHVALTAALRETTLDAVLAMSDEGRRMLARLKTRAGTLETTSPER